MHTRARQTSIQDATVIFLVVLQWAPGGVIVVCVCEGEGDAGGCDTHEQARSRLPATN